MRGGRLLQRMVYDEGGIKSAVYTPKHMLALMVLILVEAISSFLHLLTPKVTPRRLMGARVVQSIRPNWAPLLRFQRPAIGRPWARRHERPVHRDTETTGPDSRRSGDLALSHWSAAADRQTPATNREGRFDQRRTRRPLGRGCDVRLLDLQR